MPESTLLLDLIKALPQIGALLYIVVIFLKHISETNARHEKQVQEINEARQKRDDVTMNRLADIIEDNSRALGGVRRMASEETLRENDASGAFINLADAAGKMTEASLEQLATLLDLMYRANLVGEKKDGN